MSDLILREVEREMLPHRVPLPSFKQGDTIRIYFKIEEGGKEREQFFEGTVIQIKGRNLNKSVTLMRRIEGVMVERIFQLAAPNITKVELVKIGKVRRKRLFYLRHKIGKEAKIKEVFISKEAKEGVLLQSQSGNPSTQ